MSAVGQVTAKLHGADEHRELFLWKYRDVKREEVAALLKVTVFFLLSCGLSRCFSS
jgi:hypothetical protein